jgi:hypothetical protein
MVFRFIPFAHWLLSIDFPLASELRIPVENYHTNAFHLERVKH